MKGAFQVAVLISGHLTRPSYLKPQSFNDLLRYNIALHEIEPINERNFNPLKFTFPRFQENF